MEEFITTAIASLVGALAAGAIGYFFAVRRFRHERAFEGRLRWHEEAVLQLTESGEALRKAAVSMQVPELQTDVSRHFESALGSVPGNNLLMKAGMYARPKSYRALKEALRDQSELAVALIQVQRAGTSFGEPEMAERISPRILMAVARSMFHAAARLASDVRKTLGLKELKDGKELYDDKSLEDLIFCPDLTALDLAKRIDSFKDAP